MASRPAGRVLVFGSGGQVGRALIDAAHAASAAVVAAPRDDVDVTNARAVERALEAHGPTVVINASAYTAVDGAESDVERAFAVNGDGPANIAQACARAGVPLLHVSTDYVFDGAKHGPYRETDLPNPQCVYGASKLAGEERVRSALPGNHVIVRTAWVFSHTGHNFVRTIWSLARERDTLRIVADQLGSPTPADDLARTLLVMARALEADAGVAGLYHWAGVPAATWHELGEAVVQEARRYGDIPTREVVPIGTAEYPRPATRPANAALDSSRAREMFGVAPADWREGVRRVVERLQADAGG